AWPDTAPALPAGAAALLALRLLRAADGNVPGHTSATGAGRRGGEDAVHVRRCLGLSRVRGRAREDHAQLAPAAHGHRARAVALRSLPVLRGPRPASRFDAR